MIEFQLAMSVRTYHQQTNTPPPILRLPKHNTTMRFFGICFVFPHHWIRTDTNTSQTRAAPASIHVCLPSRVALVRTSIVYIALPHRQTDRSKYAPPVFANQMNSNQTSAFRFVLAPTDVLPPMEEQPHMLVWCSDCNMWVSREILTKLWNQYGTYQISF